MSYRENVTIISTSCLADGVYEMWLKTEKIAGEARPGQFIFKRWFKTAPTSNKYMQNRRR